MIERTATISGDQRYRYDLTRTWDPAKPKALWVMLNPSTADSWSEDPTLRRCIEFSRRAGMGGLVVVNLMAWRAPRPVDLPAASDAAVGPENAATVERWLGALGPDGVVVAGWGAVGPRYRALAGQTLQRLSERHDVLCLGTTKTGFPRHPGPLGQVPLDQPLELFRPAWRASA